MKWLTPAIILLLAGCVTENGQTPSEAADQHALTSATPIGEPESCIQTSRIRDTRVRGDQTIDFTMIDGRVMRSRLPHSCPGLGFEERFSYRTSIDRLCAVDIITVLGSDASPRASCGLGPFQQVEIPRR